MEKISIKNYDKPKYPIMPNIEYPTTKEGWSEFQNIITQNRKKHNINDEIIKKRVNDQIIYERIIDNSKKIIIYVHGGAFVMEDALCFIGNLAKYNFVTIEYTLAPHKQSYEIIDEVFQIMKEYTKRYDVMVVGDSAGGNLAVMAIAKLRDEKQDMPKKLLLRSPWLDLNEKYLNIEDPILNEKDLRHFAKTYVNFECDSDVDANMQKMLENMSPININLVNFPETVIEGGTNELFTASFVKFYQIMKAYKNDVRLVLYENMYHLFQAFDENHKATKDSYDLFDNFFMI